MVHSWRVKVSHSFFSIASWEDYLPFAIPNRLYFYQPTGFAGIKRKKPTGWNFFVGVQSGRLTL